MKKLIPIVLVATVSVVLFASCKKKNYTCTCNYTDASGTRQQTSGVIYGTTPQARKSCKDQGNKVSPVASDISCTISML